jgi:hypothetical protein
MEFDYVINPYLYPDGYIKMIPYFLSRMTYFDEDIYSKGPFINNCHDNVDILYVDIVMTSIANESNFQLTSYFKAELIFLIWRIENRWIKF